MPWILLAIALWFVLSRRRRRWRYARAHFNGCAGAPWVHGREQHARLHTRRPITDEMRAQRAHSTSAQPLSRFEELKRRYVSGELTDEQYEQQVDELLRQPGGMKEF